MRMSVARLLLCYVLLEDYSTNLSAAITNIGVTVRSTESTNVSGNTSETERTDSSPSGSNKVVQRDLTLEPNPVATIPGDNNVPSFAKPIGNVTAACRGEAVLSCTIRGLGNYKVAWLRAEDQTILSIDQRTVTNSVRVYVTVDNVKSRNQSFHVMAAGNNLHGNNNKDDNNEQQDATIMTEESTWRLHIRSLREADRGCYMCQVNTSPMLNQLGCVDVLVGPDILVNGTSEGEVAVTEGENATMTCNASGRPQPQVHWRSEKNNFILMRDFHDQLVPVHNSTGERLEFTRVDRKQTGAYLCIAKNEVPPAVSKRVYLRVNFPPSAKVPGELLSSPLNTDVSLICEIQASPKTINLWSKNAKVILSDERYVIDERPHPDDEWKTTIVLKIRNLRESDLGEYNCSGTSSMGRAETFVRIYEMPQVTTPRYRSTSTVPRKSNRKSKSSFGTTTKQNYIRTSTPTLPRTTSPLTSRKKHHSTSTTTTSAPSPRVPLNKDKNAFKHNEVVNLRNRSNPMRTIDGTIRILLAAFYPIAIFSFAF